MSEELKTKLIITGDSASAQAALRAVELQAASSFTTAGAAAAMAAEQTKRTMMAGYGSAKAEAKSFGTATSQLANSVKKNWVTIAGAIYIGVRALSAITGTIDQYADFEKQMATNAGVASATAEEFEYLSTSARKLAVDLPGVTATEVAQGQYYLASAGHSVNQILTEQADVLRLSVGANYDLGKSAEIVTATMSQFELGAESSTRIVNIFSAATQQSQATMRKLADSMRYAGTAGQSIDLSLEQTVGMLMKLYNAGLRGEQAGTTLRQGFTQLSKITDDGAKALGEMNIRLKDTEGRALPVTKILEQLAGKQLSLNQASRIFGQEAGTGMMILLKKMKGGLDDVGESITDTTASLSLYEKQINTTWGEMKKYESTVEELQLSIGQGLVPAYKALIGMVTPTIGVFNSLTEGEKSFIVQALAGTAATAALTITFRTAVPAMRAAFAGVNLLSSAYAGLTTATLAAGGATAAIGTVALVALPLAGAAWYAYSTAGESALAILDESIAKTKEQIEGLKEANRHALESDDADEISDIAVTGIEATETKKKIEELTKALEEMKTARANLPAQKILDEKELGAWTDAKKQWGIWDAQRNAELVARANAIKVYNEQATKDQAAYTQNLIYQTSTTYERIEIEYKRDLEKVGRNLEGKKLAHKKYLQAILELDKKQTASAATEAAKRIKIAEKEAEAKRKLEEQLDDEIMQLSSSEFEYKVYALNKWFLEMRNKHGDSEKLNQDYALKLRKITQESLEGQQSDMDNHVEVMDDLSQQMARSMQDWLADSIYDMELSLESLADTFTNIIKRMVAEAAANQIMMSIGFGGTGGIAGAAGAGGLAGLSSTFLGAGAASGIGAGTQGLMGVGGSFSAGGSIPMWAAANPYLAGAMLIGGTLYATGAFDGPKDVSAQKLYGVGGDDPHKDPLGSIGTNITKFSDYSGKGETQYAGFNLMQISDTSDRFLDLDNISDDLKESWFDLAHQAATVGEAMGGGAENGRLMIYTEEELAAMAKEASGGLAELSSSAVDFALNAALSGEAGSDLAATALSLAAATNTASAEADKQLSSQTALANAIYKTSDSTWALSQAQNAAAAAQAMIQLATHLTYDEYQKYQTAQETLIANDERRVELMKELFDGVTEERYGQIQTELAGLNTENEKYIDTVGNATGKTDEQSESLDTLEGKAEGATGWITELKIALNNLPESKEIDLTIWEERKPKAHSGLMHNAYEREMVIRRDEDVVPPERRMDYAMQVIQEAGGSQGMAGGDTINIEVGGIQVIQQPGESADEVAERVVEKIKDISQRGGKVMHQRGVFSGVA